jgi:AAA domain
MTFQKAARKAAPLMVELCGVSGSGKTTSGLLLAAGMIGPKGRVGLLDTENGRGSLMADEEIITRALPDGYEYEELFAPYTPERCVEKIKEAEKEGIDVLLFDSASQEYAGNGGISDIAETHAKGWAQAKLVHKRFLNACLSSKLDIIFCFRAQPKVRIEGKGRDQKYIDMGIVSVQEKSWAFDMTARWRIDELTHIATLLKAPRSLEDMKITERLLTRRDGELLREWKLRGKILDPMELVQKRARSAAELGTRDYLEFFESLTVAEKKALAGSTHTANKEIAAQADAVAKELAERDVELARLNAVPAHSEQPAVIETPTTPEPVHAATRAVPPSPVALPWKNLEGMNQILDVQKFRVGQKAYSDLLASKNWTKGDLKPEGGASVEFYQALKGLPPEETQGTILPDDSF